MRHILDKIANFLLLGGFVVILAYLIIKYGQTTNTVVIPSAYSTNDTIFIAVGGGVFLLGLFFLILPNLIRCSKKGYRGPDLPLDFPSNTRSVGLYEFVTSLLFLPIKIFFHKVEAFGIENIPENGPVIIAAGPHANQFLDPIIVQYSSEMKVGFLAAAVSMKRFFVGGMARMLESIPVERPTDYATPGTGTLTTNKTQVTGINTKFTSEFKKGHSIGLPGWPSPVAEVEQVISDTEMILKRPFDQEFENSVFKWVPKLDQATMFEKVYDCLSEGRCVGIFPEGFSHDYTELLPLKPGVALMALGACQKYPGLEVKIVPCGISYFNAYKFRSTACVLYANPITITSEMTQKYSKGGADKREVINQVMDTLSRELHTITLNVANSEILEVILTARRLFLEHNQSISLTEKMKLTRKFARGYERIKDEPKVKETFDKIVMYNRMLRDYGLTDYQVRKTQINKFHAFTLLLWRIFLMIIYLIFAIPALILNLIPLFIIHQVAKKHGKAEGRDVIGTWKVLTGVTVIPTFYLVYVLFVTLFIVLWNKPYLPLFWRIIVPILSAIFIPLISYLGMRFIETGVAIFRSFTPLFWSLSPFASSEKHQLLETRQGLRKEVLELIETALGKSSLKKEGMDTIKEIRKEKEKEKEKENEKQKEKENESENENNENGVNVKNEKPQSLINETEIDEDDQLFENLLFEEATEDEIHLTTEIGIYPETKGLFETDSNQFYSTSAKNSKVELIAVQSE